VLSYALRRVLHSLPVLVVMSVVVFSMILLVPGDPVLTYLGPGADVDPRAIEAMRQELGLDEPVVVQYWEWVKQVAQGDLGQSVGAGQSVRDALLERLPVTLQLSFYATIFALVIALPLGVLTALRRNTLWDTVLSTVSVGGISVPNFFFAILMILLFAVNLQWLPASGYVPFSDDPVENFKHMLMPALALALPIASILIRQIRTTMIEVLSQDFIRTGRAKGLSEFHVITRHAIPNALIAPLTVLGLLFVGLMGGVLIIEMLFGIPGIGSFVVGAVFQRDFQVVQGGALLIGVLVIVINLIVDLLYVAIDPRMKESRT
jgi:peptide/nickel transport system permease protein